MIIKPITYTDYNGLTRTEEHCFHLSKGELMEMQVTTEGGLVEMLKRIVANHDYPTIYKTFKEIVLKAYGVKSPDGRRFMKVDDHGVKLCHEFEETEAFSVLMMELATDDKAAADFVNGLIPADLNKQVATAANN